MNNILKFFIIITTIFLISACGTSSTGGTSASSLSIETGKSVDFNNNKMGINFSIKSSYPSDVEIHLKDLKIRVTPSSCVMKTTPIFTPSPIILNGSETKNVYASVEFKDGCTPTSYKLEGTTVIAS